MLLDLAEKLEHDAITPIRALVGLDGFVDEIVHVVDKRLSATEFRRIKTLKEYGERIAASSGLSTNVEIVTIDRRPGGNGPIFALGLKKLRADVTYIGCVGTESVDGVFAQLAHESRIIGVGQPSYTDAMEFDDGKLIRSKLNSLNNLVWQDIIDRVSEAEFAGLLDEMQLVSFNNWTMIAAMNDIWEHILQDVLPLLTTNPQEKMIFFDLADPEKREPKEIAKALELIRGFKMAGFQTVLGLNKKEAFEIAKVFGYANLSGAELRSLTEFISKHIEIDCVVVHPIDSAACVKDGKYYEVRGAVCPEPKLSTGAGDNFNAGFVIGYASNYSMESCLLMGIACSGYYVRNCSSPTINEVSGFLKKWHNGMLDKSI